MKTIYRISLFFNLLCACYLLIKGSAFYYQNHTEMPEVKEEFRTVKEETVAEKEESVLTAAGESVTSCDTDYIIKSYDYTTKTYSTEERSLPTMYLDKNREELEDLLSDYAISPSLTDLEKGFETVTLDSFSKNMVIITKYYRSVPKQEPFYLLVEDDYITVYCEDLTNVFLYTNIYMNDLPERLQQEILDKKYIASEEELYNFLESYSS